MVRRTHSCPTTTTGNYINNNGILTTTTSTNPKMTNPRMLNHKQEMPSASSMRDKATKSGHLKKLSGKGILTSGTWRDRFCVLVKSKLYFYENETSDGQEKSSGFVNLEYFDTCTEATTRMARKATNVFVIGSTEKGFFESHSGRHYFAAETLTEMREWVSAINSAMMSHLRGKHQKQEKRTRDGSLTPGSNNTSVSKKDSLKSTKNDPSSLSENNNACSSLPRSSDVTRLDHVTKGRPKGPQGRRLPRKPHAASSRMLSDSRPDEAVDCIDDSSDVDEVLRDSRGRATSLSALAESSSIGHHPNGGSSGGPAKLNCRLGSSSLSAGGGGADDRIDFDLCCSSSRSSSSSESSPRLLSSSCSTSSPVNNATNNSNNHASSRSSDFIATTHHHDDSDESFEHAWFIRMPRLSGGGGGGGGRCSTGAGDEDIESTSDYSSMHGSPPSPKTTTTNKTKQKQQKAKKSGSAKTGDSSDTTGSNNSSLKSKFHKIICSLL